MWVRIDDHVPDHPKFLKAGPIASWLWVCGNCHCNKYLTDGFIEEAVVRGLGQIPQARKHAATLVLVGLWECCEGGYRVHDFHDHNPRAEQIKAKRHYDRLRRSEIRGESSMPHEKIRGASSVPHEPSRDRDPIPVPSQSPPGPEKRTNARAAGVMAGTLPREHLRHAWCSGRGKCVPDFLHAQFMRAVGGDERAASQRLTVFYEATEHGWPEGPIGDDEVKLWKQEFAAKFPSIAPISAGKSAGNLAALERFATKKLPETS